MFLLPAGNELTSKNSALANIGIGFGAIKTKPFTIPVESSPAITGYDTKEWDYANAFNVETGYYTIPIYGIWRFTSIIQYDTREAVQFTIGFYVQFNNTFHQLQSVMAQSEYRDCKEVSVEFSLPAGAQICAIITASDNIDISGYTSRFCGELIHKI